MPRPRFSEMLLARRRQLGLTCEQASRILKLREDVLVAFEEGDFESMPQSGYAQGMLSSYARYLGLNAREVVDLFQEELYEYVNGSGSHELRRRTRDTLAGRGISGYDVVNEAGSRPKAYVEYHGLLPTAGGPAGDMGNFATVTPARPRQSVPLAGLGPSAVAAYGREDYGRTQQARVRQQRPYNSGQGSEPRQQRSTARRRASGQRRPQSDPAGRLLREGQQGVVDRDRDLVSPRGRAGQARTQRLYQRDDVSTRSVRSGEYRDDLRYDGVARPYERASTISGRRSSRNIAAVERPNVRRRQPSGRGGAQQGRRRQRQRRGGVAGVVEAFLSDSRRALLLLFLVLAVALTLILVFSVRSCTSSSQGTQSGGKTVNVTTTQQSGQDASQGQSSSADASSSGDSQAATSSAAASATGDASSDATATGDASGDAAAAEQTVVQVSLKSGEASWVEVTVDGKSVVADNLTGAWSQSYTVTDSITIQVSNVDAVTVTNNGKKVDFTSKTSGVGTLTIKGTPAPESTDGETGSDASDGSSAAAAGSSASSSSSTSSKSSSGAKSTSATSN